MELLRQWDCASDVTMPKPTRTGPCTSATVRPGETVGRGLARIQWERSGSHHEAARSHLTLQIGGQASSRPGQSLVRALQPPIPLSRPTAPSPYPFTAIPRNTFLGVATQGSEPAGAASSKQPRAQFQLLAGCVQEALGPCLFRTLGLHAQCDAEGLCKSGRACKPTEDRISGRSIAKRWRAAKSVLGHPKVSSCRGPRVSASNETLR